MEIINQKNKETKITYVYENDVYWNKERQ